jgi:hypothetical protein
MHAWDNRAAMLHQLVPAVRAPARAGLRIAIRLRTHRLRIAAAVAAVMPTTAAAMAAVSRMAANTSRALLPNQARI